MARYLRNTAILAKVESSYGVDPTPTAGANAMLVSNVTLNPLNAQNVSRDLVRPYFGGSEQLVGTAYVEMTFDIELAGSGTAGTNPAWFPLLEGCGFAVSNTASVRSNAYPETPADGSVTIYYYLDGVLHKSTGCRGDMDINLGVGERPRITFKFQGIDAGRSATTPGTLTLTAFQKPLVVTDSNTGDATFGATFNIDALTPAITGGTAYPSRGMTLAMGNQVQFTPLLGGETVDITNREVSGHIDLDLTAAQEVTFMTNVVSNTTQSIAIKHGTTAGNLIYVFMPNVQLINPTMQDTSGRLLVGFDLRATPSSGNDDIRIVVA